MYSIGMRTVYSQSNIARSLRKYPLIMVRYEGRLVYVCSSLYKGVKFSIYDDGNIFLSIETIVEIRQEMVSK